MIALDTGPIVALFDKEDDNHQICTKIFKEIHEPLITTGPVLTEAFYLLSFSCNVQDDLWEFIERGIVGISQLDRQLMRTCRELMRKYKDLPMDLADASVVAAADAENIFTIFTVDKDFKVYRTKHGKHFKLLPAKL
ncbi:MAG: PIN domain-containing protein [Nitrospirae bacterium]|nr:PIN domain-containing protein [Nitrospirota bacterium]